MYGKHHAMGPEPYRRTFIRWPTRTLGPRPGLKEINLAAWALFIVFIVFPILYVILVLNKPGSTSFPKLRDGFVYMYGIGHIVNEYPAVRLYDYSLQQKIFNEISRNDKEPYGPSPYPPFLALLFSLFARVPFNAAYLLWAGASLALYIAGIFAAAAVVYPRDRLKTSLIICCALAFYPFCFYTLVSGRISTLAVFSVGLAIFLEGQSKPFRSGLVLSVLTYKPTLLLLVIPMLFLTRRFRTLSGFISGAAILIAASTAFAGIEIWPAYAHFLVLFGRVAGLNGHPDLNLSKYIDFDSFSYAVPVLRSRLGLTALIGAGATIVSGLAVLLWKSAGAGRPAQNLAWAATLTWTLVLNVYVPIYDSVLVTIAVILTIGALSELEWSAATGWMGFLYVSIFASSFVTEAIARRHGVQILSILLAILGIAQLILLRRAIQASQLGIKSLKVPVPQIQTVV